VPELAKLRMMLEGIPRCSGAPHAGAERPPVTRELPTGERLCDACVGALAPIARDLPYAAEVRKALRLLGAVDEAQVEDLEDV
jgi:hypothetical protein